MITIDSEKCIHCGQCTVVCPMSLIQQQNEDSVPAPITQAEDFCIQCGHCVAICDSCAIDVGDVIGSRNEPFTQSELPSFEQYVALVKSRRSIRRYKKEAVEKAKLDKLLDVVRWAPSAKNTLPVKWIVVNNPQTVNELAGLVVEWVKTLGEMQHLVKTWESGIDMIHRGAPCLMIAYTDPEGADWGDIDCTIAMETVEYGAKVLGLGACWAGYFTRASRNYAEIPERLGLKKDQTIRAALMLGEIDDEHYDQIPYRREAAVRWME